MLYQLLFVGLGGATGSMARFLLSSNVLAGYSIMGFPAGTFAVNIVGSLMIGVFMSLLSNGSASQWFFITGVCGGFTTFSTFSADMVNLIKLQKWDAATLYIMLSIVIALAFTMAGMWLGTMLKKMFA